MTCKSFVLYDQADTQNVTKNALARVSIRSVTNSMVTRSLAHQDAIDVR